MRIALLTTFKASRKDPLAGTLERIHAAFLAAGEGEPSVRFRFADSPLGDSASIVDRAIRRQPSLARFAITGPVLPGSPPLRQLSNETGSPVAGEPAEFSTLLAIADGVPRSFPFHTIGLRFHSPAFGEPVPLNSPEGLTSAGVIVGDSWWVNGRIRTLMAVTTVDGDPAARRLPALPAAVEAIFGACGKIESTVQIPLFTAASPDTSESSLALAQAVQNVVSDYRARLAEIIDHAALPHDLPPAAEARAETLGKTSGPKKPVLARAFRPLGYDCRGDSGTFTLRRRTASNLTVEVSLDVGTWSNSLTGFFHVYGLGFTAMLPLPVSKRAIERGQYPIGNPENWARIGENLAALVAALDRDFVPAVEAAAGPSPDWYSPDS